MAKRWNFSAAVKAKVALEALRGDQTLAELVGRHKVHQNLITKWKRQAGAGMVEVFSGKQGGRKTSHQRPTSPRQLLAHYANFPKTVTADSPKRCKVSPLRGLERAHPRPHA